MAIIPNAGLQQLNDYVLGIEAAFGPLEVRLFVNDYTPGTLTVTGNLTECTAGGYAGEEIDPGDWSAAFVGDVLTYDHDPITFTFSDNGGGQTLYGFYIVDTESGITVAAGRFLNPYAIPGGGGTYAVKPSWRDGACAA